MKITKFGHSCLLVEENGIKILIDPGSWSVVPKLENIDAILITHEHGDHCAVDTVKQLLTDNPKAIVYTNAGVKTQLDGAGVTSIVLKKGESVKVNNVEVKAFGEKHEIIYRTLPVFENVGFFIAGRLFHPGDSYELPNVPVEILALPVAAPWTDVSRMIDFAIAIKPKVAFPIHDAFLKERNPFHPHAERECKAAGIEWKVLRDGEIVEF